MDDAKSRDIWRSLILFAVLGLHIALIAVLLMASSTRGIAVSSVPSVDLLFLPPKSIPRIVSENFPPKLLNSAITIPVAPPVLDSVSMPPSVSRSMGRRQRPMATA
jgi:hypothetical protein